MDEKLEKAMEEYKDSEVVFTILQDQIRIRKELEAEIEKLRILLDEKQQKIDFYEGTYFKLEAAAKERMEIIESQRKEIEKYRKESIFRPIRTVKSRIIK